MVGNNGNGHVGKLWLIRDLEGKLEPRSGGESPSVDTALEFGGAKEVLSWEDIPKFSHKELSKIHVVHVEGTLADFLNRAHEK